MALADELKALLTKYDVNISFECDWCSDLHGVTGEHIAVVSNKTGEKLIVSDLYSYSLGASDIP